MLSKKQPLQHNNHKNGSNTFLSNRRNTIALVGFFFIECFLAWICSILFPWLSVFVSTLLQRFCTYQIFFIIRSQTQSVSVNSKGSSKTVQGLTHSELLLPLYRCIKWHFIAFLKAPKPSSCSEVEGSDTNRSLLQLQSGRQGLTQTPTSSLLLPSLLAHFVHSELQNTVAFLWVYSTCLSLPSSKIAGSFPYWNTTVYDNYCLGLSIGPSSWSQCSQAFLTILSPVVYN